MSRPRLLIADDQEPMRFLLTLLAEADCEVVGEAENGQQAVEAVEQLCPDLLLLDLSMPGMDGWDAVRHLREHRPELAILLVSGHEQPAYAERALRLGVKAYVLKQTAPTEVPLALREVLAGRVFCSPRLAVS